MAAIPPGSGNRAVSDRAAVDAYVTARAVEETAQALHEARARFDALEAAGDGRTDETRLAWRAVEVAATAHSAALDDASRAATVAALSQVDATGDVPAPTTPMDLETRTGDGRCTVALRGEFDMGVADQVEAELLRRLDDPGIEELRVDLAEVTFLDSSGLRVLVRVLVEADAGHRRLVLAHVGDRIRRTLEFARLDRVFAPR